MADDNPYSVPQSELQQDPGERRFALAASPRTAAMGRGFSWIAEGYSGYFRRSWGPWIGAMVLIFIVFIVFSLIPVVNILFQVLTPFVWYAGLAIGCRAQAQDQPFRVSHSWAGFGKRVGSLILLSFAYNVAFIAIVALALGLVSPELLTFDEQAFSSVNPRVAPQQVWLAVLLALALTLPVIMATFFAPHLIVFHEQSLLSAVRLSFIGCARNVLPFLLWGIGFLLLFIAQMVIVGVLMFAVPLAIAVLVLGLLALLPVMTASIYIAYEDIFLQG